MTTEQLTIDQRLTNLELGQERLEAEVLSNSRRLDRLESQVATLVAGHIAIVESLAEIKATLARVEERQDAHERRMDERQAASERRMDERQAASERRMDEWQAASERRFDKLESKYDKILYWVLSLMTAAVVGALAVAVRLVFFPT